MLTIEEIKKELDADKKVIAELEDPNGLRKLGISESFIQEWINNDVSIRAYNCIYFITSNGVGILHDNLISYFRIKRPSPTFDGLIDVAFNAVKNGVLTCIELFEDSIFIYLDHVGYDTKKPSFSICRDIESETSRIAEVIDKINSLYTETFVIENNGDMMKLKIGDKFSHNGSVVTIDRYLLDKLMNVPIFLTRGATVTQKRGGYEQLNQN